MENDVGKDEIGKRPFIAQIIKLRLVIFVDLNSQADAQYEARNGRDEAGQE